jgi:peptidoglycan L-alanyl-D-glutamate endopeptidase CwlK
MTITQRAPGSWKLSARDESRLGEIDQKMASVVRLAAQKCALRFMVTEGRRTQARQDALYAQGRTAPGQIVTWTRSSKHIDGLAVDLAPLDDAGGIPWGDFTAFDAIAKAMFAAAAELGVRIRWGADWDRDGKPREKGESDSPHFELVR